MAASSPASSMDAAATTSPPAPQAAPRRRKAATGTADQTRRSERLEEKQSGVDYRKEVVIGESSAGSSKKKKKKRPAGPTADPRYPKSADTLEELTWSAMSLDRLEDQLDLLPQVVNKCKEETNLSCLDECKDYKISGSSRSTDSYRLKFLAGWVQQVATKLMNMEEAKQETVDWVRKLAVETKEAMEARLEPLDLNGSQGVQEDVQEDPIPRFVMDQFRDQNI